jgi:eukaryotic-like serine/threonine-protein kinase
LVLYEAVTGTVPFVTDTTMGTLAARIGQPLPHDPLLGPLDDVLARAAAPEAKSRLDAAGLAARLGALAAALPVPASLPLTLGGATTSAPIMGFHAPGVGELTGETEAVGTGSATGTMVAGTAVTAGANGAPVGTKAGPGEIFDAEPLRGRAKGTKTKVKGPRRPWNKRKTALIVAAVVVLALVGGGLAAAFATNVFTPSHPTPALTGLTLAEAQASVAKVHMSLKVEAPVKSITVAAGTVVSQDPAPRVSEKEGTVIRVVPSGGPPIVTVPSLTGMTCATATAQLQQDHFKAVCAPPRYDNSTPVGQLVLWSIGATPNPSKAPYGSTITLVPSQGHSPVNVPPIPTSYTYAQAQAALSAVGLGATQQNQSSTTVPNGQVISTNPASGQPAPYGSAVTVVVSTGPPTTTVPSSVIGESVLQASTTLRQAGLGVSGVSGDPSKNVVGTQPSVGSTVPTGSSIQLFTQGH